MAERFHVQQITRRARPVRRVRLTPGAPSPPADPEVGKAAELGVAPGNETFVAQLFYPKVDVVEMAGRIPSFWRETQARVIGALKRGPLSLEQLSRMTELPLPYLEHALGVDSVFPFEPLNHSLDGALVRLPDGRYALAGPNEVGRRREGAAEALETQLDRALTGFRAARPTLDALQRILASENEDQLRTAALTRETFDALDANQLAWGNNFENWLEFASGLPDYLLIGHLAKQGLSLLEPSFYALQRAIGESDSKRGESALGELTRPGASVDGWKMSDFRRQCLERLGFGEELPRFLPRWRRALEFSADLFPLADDRQAIHRLFAGATTAADLSAEALPTIGLALRELIRADPPERTDLSTTAQIASDQAVIEARIDSPAGWASYLEMHFVLPSRITEKLKALRDASGLDPRPIAAELSFAGRGISPHIAALLKRYIGLELEVTAVRDAIIDDVLTVLNSALHVLEEKATRIDQVHAVLELDPGSAREYVASPAGFEWLQTHGLINEPSLEAWRDRLEGISDEELLSGWANLGIKLLDASVYQLKAAVGPRSFLSLLLRPELGGMDPILVENFRAAAGSLFALQPDTLGGDLWLEPMIGSLGELLQLGTDGADINALRDSLRAAGRLVRNADAARSALTAAWEQLTAAVDRSIDARGVPRAPRNELIHPVGEPRLPPALPGETLRTVQFMLDRMTVPGAAPAVADPLLSFDAEPREATEATPLGLIETLENTGRGIARLYELADLDLRNLHQSERVGSREYGGDDVRVAPDLAATSLDGDAIADLLQQSYSEVIAG